MNNAGVGFTGIVMAGGRSTRMGRDKALLVLESGRTLIEQACETLRATGANEVWVSVGVGKTYGLTGAREIADLQSDCGPLGGLSACLAALTQPLCLVLAVDMPAMQPAYLAGLIKIANPDCGVVPVRDGSAEPLAAVYPQKAVHEFSRAFQAGDFSMQRLIRNLEQKHLVRLQNVSDSERRFFANWNSPADCR